jgi:hypothetical protein
MKRKASALTFILSLLVSVLAGTLLIQNGARTFIVQAETANSDLIIEGDTNANVTIQSPENKAYNENNVTLAVTVESGVPPMEYFDMSLFGLFLRYGCALDYDTSALVDLIWNSNLLDKFPKNPPLVLNGSENVYTGNATLTNLSQGAHTLTVWVRAEQFMLSYSWGVWAIFKTVSFNIDFTPPHILILSPEPKVYNIFDVPLVFTVNETASQISYSLDGQENITAAGNLTLTRLSNGVHNVTVYAADEAGNMGASEAVTFTVAVPEPFPTELVIAASVATVAVVGVGLLVYYKKRKRVTV